MQNRKWYERPEKVNGATGALVKLVGVCQCRLGFEQCLVGVSGLVIVVWVSVVSVK